RGRCSDESRGPDHWSALMQFWLRRFVVDPKSGRVLERWDDHPLPPQLGVRHLRSYLEQRFGRPITPGPDAQGGFTFRTRDSSRNAVMVAIPAARDPRSGELVAIYERFGRLRGLAASIGMPNAVDTTEFDSEETWNGPLLDPDYTRRITNDAAARA